jgi:putative PIN family toxin of toxin-antitoxin system
LPILDLIAISSELFQPVAMKQAVSRDADDDKFIALCLSAHCQIIISGDKDLLEISGYMGIDVFKPANFVEIYLA